MFLRYAQSRAFHPDSERSTVTERGCPSNQLNQARIEGTTSTGRATAQLLKSKIPIRILERQVLMGKEQYPGNS